MRMSLLLCDIPRYLEHGQHIGAGFSAAVPNTNCLDMKAKHAILLGGLSNSHHEVIQREGARRVQRSGGGGGRALGLVAAKLQGGRVVCAASHAYNEVGHTCIPRCTQYLLSRVQSCCLTV